jgi:diacylglycerol kinase (ATP)
MKKRIKSFKHAFNGLNVVMWKEANLNIHFIISILVVVFGVIFSISKTEWMICILCFGLVISLEIINSSIENLVNLISPEYNVLAGKVKDIAAGAVLIAAICSAIVGLLIFIPYGWHWIIKL